MSGFNLSLIDPGPNQAGIQVPILGTPTVVNGVSVPTILGMESGYHLNCAQSVLDATPAAAPYVVVPQSPVCVWAGAVTVFLKFPDAATAQSVLANYWTASA
jgi:hypothetical protein